MQEKHGFPSLRNSPFLVKQTPVRGLPLFIMTFWGETTTHFLEERGDPPFAPDSRGSPRDSAGNRK